MGTVTVQVTRRPRGGSEYDDAEYLRKVYEESVSEPVPVKSIQDIADIISGIDTEEGDVINITLNYNPKRRNNIVIECTLLQKQITATLLATTGKSIIVELIYNTDTESHSL